MLEKKLYNELVAIRAMAKLLYENADKVLKEEKEPGVSRPGSKKPRGMSDEVRARFIAKRKAKIAKSLIHD